VNARRRVAAPGPSGVAAGVQADFRAIVEQQSELVSLARADGVLIYVNPAYARHFGRVPADMIGLSLYDFVEPADREVVSLRIGVALQTGQSVSGDNRMVASDGSERWVAWTNLRQLDDAGQPLLHSVGRDVTDRKRAEQALRESQAFLLRIERVAGVGGWQFDLTSRLITWSDETRRIHEVGADYVPTFDRAIEFYAPEVRPVVESAVRRGIEHGQAWDLELPFVTATGRPIWVRAVGEAEFVDGVPVRLIGAFQDITERRRLQARLADSERFVRQIADSLPVRIAYVDRERRFRFVNHAHAERFGRDPADIVGRTRSELFQGQGDPEVEARVDAVLAGQPQRFEFDETVGGRLRRIESRLIPDVAETGEVRGFFSTGIDITERNAAELALRELTTIFDNTTDYVVQTDWHGTITYMNPAVRRALGIAADAPLTDRNFAEFNTAATNRLFADVIVPAVKAAGVWVGETTVYDADRREVPISHMVIAHRDRAGRVERYSAVMRDISSEVRAKAQLQRQAATLRSVAEALPAMVAVVGTDYRYRFVNSSFERWIGAQRDRIVGRTMIEVLGRAEFERSKGWVQRALAGESVSFEKDYPDRRGGRHLAISYVPMWLDSSTVDGFVGIALDITRHKHEEVRLLQLSQRDALTGLLNRAGFQQELERQAQGDAALLALLYIDLDHFKPVNDSHGHPVGDAVLQQFARRLAESVRPTDAVSRLGGDEFAILLVGVRESANARAVADKVIAAACSPFDVGALRLQIGASVGVAFGIEPAGGWRDLVARADAALYRAKEAGRGRQAGETR
jgi:diguanylate cyclase (GGDEF)-like protein/PAS domain S-box-containing protein